jgi:cobalamin biosynthesis protein CobC
MPRHGGSGEDFLRQYYPGAATPWRDLSTGINPHAYPRAQISAAALQKLPSPSLMALCRTAAVDYFGVPAKNLAVLPGSQAAISLLPELFEHIQVAVVEPGYSEHVASWKAAGHDVTVIDNVQDANADILVLTNPNNPDGKVWNKEELLAICAARSARGQWLVIDEAFADLTPEISLAGSAGNLVIFRSFGKFFGLGGVRLGFAIAPPALARKLEDSIGPWAVSGAALEIGARAYADRGWQVQTRHRLSDAARRLRALLNRYGLGDAGGTDLFLLTDHTRAAELFDRLCIGGIYVRRFVDHPRWLRFGLPGDEAGFLRLEECLRAWAQTP